MGDRASFLWRVPAILQGYSGSNRRETLNFWHCSQGWWGVWSLVQEVCEMNLKLIEGADS